MTETTATDAPLFELVDPKDLPKVPGRVAKASKATKDKIAGGKDTYTVPFGDLLLGNDNVRDAVAAGEIPELAESIRQAGLATALTVSKHKGGKWLLMAGHRRYLALRALGFTAKDKVPVSVRTPGKESHDRLRLMVAENSHRKDLTAMDEAEAIGRMVDWHKMTQAAIAKELGMNKNTVSLRLGLLELPTSAQDAVASGMVGLEAAQSLGRAIKAGLSERSTANLATKAANGSLRIHHIEEARRDERKAKQAETLASRLSARGVTVITKYSQAVVPDGHQAVAGGFGGDWEKAAEIKALDIGALDTLTDPDGKPYLLVKTMWNGAGAFRVKVAPKPEQQSNYSEYRRQVAQNEEANQTAWIAENATRLKDSDVAAAVVHALHAVAWPDVEAFAGRYGLAPGEGMTDRQQFQAWAAQGPDAARLVTLGLISYTFDGAEHPLTSIGCPELTPEEFETAVKALAEAAENKAEEG